MSMPPKAERKGNTNQKKKKKKPGNEKQRWKLVWLIQSVMRKKPRENS